MVPSCFFFSLWLLGTLATPSLHGFVDTRQNCPPEGYVAISPSMNLASLPAGGQYAICQTSEQNFQYELSPGDNTFDWILANGTFRLRDSTLIVDDDVQIETEWPALVDWERVVVKPFPPDDRLGDTDWAGIRINGQPGDLTVAPPPHHGTYGHCGNLREVRIDLFANRGDGIRFTNCTVATLKDIAVYGGSDAFEFRDCRGLIAYDLVGAGFISDGIDVGSSSLAFIRPVITEQIDADGLEAEEGSFVTVCDGFFHTGDDFLQIGDDDDDEPSTIVIAGPTNAFFPDNVFFDGQGLLVTLAKCPTVLSSTGYDMRLWETYFTNSPQ